MKKGTIVNLPQTSSAARTACPLERPLRVLLFDDRSGERERVAHALAGAFSEIIVDQTTDAAKFAAALTGAANHDLVLVNLRFYESRGLSALRTLKHRRSGCPVILLTEVGALDIAIDTMKAGLDDLMIQDATHYARLPLRVRATLERAREFSATREAETRLRSLFDNVPVGLYRMSPEGDTLEANLATLQLSGCPDFTALLSHNVADFFPDAKKFAVWCDQVAAQGTLVITRGLFRKLDGSLIRVRNSARAVRDGDGRLLHIEGALEDVTDLYHAEQQLRASEARLRAIVDAEPECVKIVAADGELLLMNPAGLAMIEADTIEQARQAPLVDLVVPEYRNAFQVFAERVFQGHKGSMQYEIVGWKGTRRWLESYAVPLPEDSSGRTLLLSVTRDITQHKSAEARLSQLAQYDGLTGLPNRALFIDRLQRAMIDAERHQRLVGVVFLDLDRFKNINDTLGHDVGDQVLKEVAERLQNAVRKDDTVARLSGDELVLVLADMAHTEDAGRVAQKILDVFIPLFLISGRELRLTASLGIALYPADGKDASELLRAADVAMYRAKENGRNAYQFYTTEMTTRAIENLALENDLRQAIKRSELVLHYQPVIDSASGAIISLEALVRWQHPHRGLIPPMQFIPLAEDTGLIAPIGEWVLRTAALACRHWRANGWPDLRVAVNLSARQFRSRGLVSSVCRVLDEVGLPPDGIEIEITENVLLEQDNHVLTELRALSDMGIALLVDDFGTGYSSLSYLRRYPVDALKIDRSFTCDISTDPDDAAIVTAIITMAHTLGLRVVAEGVETEAQLGFLRDHGCEAWQGFYYSHPLPADELTRLLQKPQP